MTRGHTGPMARVRPVYLMVLAVVFAVAIFSLGDPTVGVIAGMAFGAGAVILAIVDVIAVTRTRRRNRSGIPADDREQGS